MAFDPSKLATFVAERARYDDWMTELFPPDEVAHLSLDRSTGDGENEVRWLHDHGYTFVVTVL